jgi:hypothetical protein
MTDWTKQAEETMRTWTKAHQQLWESWKSAMPQAGATQAGEAWEKVVDYWKEAIDKSLGAQAEWADLWASSVRSQAGAPKELGAWTEQMASTMKTWTESQSQLWQDMLDSFKQATPEALALRLDESAQAAFKTWQDAIQKAVEAQRELTKHWTGQKAKEKA